MRLLALEAGGAVLSAALFEDGAPVDRAWLRAPRAQTERLAPLVRELLGRAGWAPKSLGALACGRGPGSFAGLRSSLAFGRGLALAVPGLALVPVSTLAAWAEAFAPRESPEALVLLDGRRGQAYRARLKRVPPAAGGEAGSASWAHAVEPRLMDVAEALAEDKASPGAARLTDLDPAPGGFRTPGLDGPELALACGRLALAALAAGGPLPAWEPEYLRRSEAEILWERLHPEAARPAPPRAGSGAA